ncbi:MAG: TylF/MycF family methyltransferase [Bryobacteraceae bacterium]|nr:TylF/MycF family methyltransferase [Bryobacteraceae bacterium]
MARLNRAFLLEVLRRFGFAVVNARKHYADDGLATLHGIRFRKDPGFIRAYARGVLASDGHDPRVEWRVHVALWAARTALQVPGDFVECGVNAGLFSSAIMEYLNWSEVDRRFFLVDTFTGPVFHQYSPEEVKRGRLDLAKRSMAAGAYATDLPRITRNFAEWPNAIVVQGEVPSVLNSLPCETISFLHLDMNCAKPEKLALESLWSRLAPGAIILIDDYTYLDDSLQADGIDEVARGWNASVLCLPTGQGLIVR